MALALAFHGLWYVLVLMVHLRATLSLNMAARTEPHFFVFAKRLRLCDERFMLSPPYVVASPMAAAPPAAGLVLPLPWQMVAGALGTSCACMISHPLEVAKARLQVDGELARHARQYRGLGHAARSIAMKEGVRGLWAGIVPGIMFQVRAYVCLALLALWHNALLTVVR